ncbi:MAG: hypothetical protein OXG23_05155 [Chloroflexi bacterium]|nr:hypothetical protein [Chloroflexota bacterium]
MRSAGQRESRVKRLLREHRHFIIVVTLLTLVVTFPTILYVFRTDVFWLPTGGDRDAFTEIWDVWYGRLILGGQADRFFADTIFYPTGVSLVYHPINFPYVIVVSGLQAFMSVSSAFSLAYLLIIYCSTLAAYVYLRWLFKSNWIGLFGAVVFGFSPHVIGHPSQPNNALVATMPLLIYGFHRGIRENRRNMVIGAGLLTGLTSVINIYAYVCAVLSLGLMAFAFALTRWRSKRFRLLTLFLVVAIAISSLWRIYPMMADSLSLDAAIGWRGNAEQKTDLISYFVNHEHPIIGPLLHGLLRTPSIDRTFSPTSYLGYLPLCLIAFGLFSKNMRRKMLPWLALCAMFLVLRLGMALRINGVLYSDILLPQFYLAELLPFVFRSFFEVDNYQIGVILPLAVLSSYGIAALQDRWPEASRSGFIILLIAVVAFEYYIPVKGWVLASERRAFSHWLDQEEGDIRLINLPMGRNSAKLYNLYQALNDHPHAEGAISRTPDSAFNYIRANFLLNAWHNHRPVNCDMPGRDSYLAGLAQLEEDGFSHVVYHHNFSMMNYTNIQQSFRGVEPSYRNDFASVYRLNDLRESCPSQLSAHHLFSAAAADALQHGALPIERHGTAVVFPPTPLAGDHLMRFLRHFAEVERTVVIVTSDEQGNIAVQSSALPDADSPVALDQFTALWLVSEAQAFSAVQTAAFQDWFVKRFSFCERFIEDERSTVDLYLRADISCEAMGERSAFEVHYESDVRLHNASYDVMESTLRVFLAWTNATSGEFAFSLQLFDDAGNKAVQFDNVIYDELLTVHEIDVTSLRPGAYTVQLIVYDFESGVSQSGTIADTGERFDRTLEIAQIEL